MRRTKYNKEFKLEIVNRYIKGESASLLANELDYKGAAVSIVCPMQAFIIGLRNIMSLVNMD